jgi:hypothetical protein
VQAALWHDNNKKRVLKTGQACGHGSASAGAHTAHGSRTIATYGYRTITSRITFISASRFSAHTSRISTTLPLHTYLPVGAALASRAA